MKSGKSEEFRATALDAVTINSLLHEYRAGKDPLVTYEQAHACLTAIGRPLTYPQVRDLLVDVKILGGRCVGRLVEFVKAADGRIERLLKRLNLKSQAAATARAAKRSKTEAA